MVARPHTLGLRLATERTRRRWSQRALGERLGLANGNFIGMVERGERLPSDELTRRLARELEIPERDLLQLRYEADPRSALPILLAPPAPSLPRLRQILIATCLRPDPIANELSGAARPLIERILWATLRDCVLLPALARDRQPPRRLAALLGRAARAGEATPSDAAFEEEGEMVSSYLQLVLAWWDLDPATLHLTMRVKASEEPPNVLALVPSLDGASSRGSSLVGALEAAGLDGRDVEEVVALVAFKRARQAAADPGL